MRPGGWPRLLPVLAPVLVAAGLLAWMAFRPIRVTVPQDPGDAWLDRLPTPAEHRRDLEQPPVGRGAVPLPDWDAPVGDRWSLARVYQWHTSSGHVRVMAGKVYPPNPASPVRAAFEAEQYEGALYRERARVAARQAEQAAEERGTMRADAYAATLRALPAVAGVAWVLTALFWVAQLAWLRAGPMVPIRIRLSPAGVDLDGERIGRGELLGVGLHGDRVVFATRSGTVATPALADAGAALDALRAAGLDALVLSPDERAHDDLARAEAKAWAARLAGRIEEP